MCSLRWSSAGTRDNSGKLSWRISDRIPLWVECAISTTGFKPTPAKRRLAGGSPAIHIALVHGSRPVLAVVDDRVVGAAAFELSHGKVASLRGIAARTGARASTRPGGSTNQKRRSSQHGDQSRRNPVT
ncbi:hypothetical protein [Streptomyces sp. PmtA]|uniref:hypothetical protein n=1 Tax=Streptomyces sp. PmtA TaxID=3074275 RepID=UPI003FCCCDB6